MKKFLKWSSISLVSFVMAVAVAFFFAIGCGIVPAAQDLWVESAMTTFHHHYLAELIVPPSVIDEHQEMLVAQQQAQNNITTDTDLVSTDKKENNDTSDEEAARLEEAKYAAEGYYKESDGVYIKEITGTSTAGKYVGYLMLCPDPSRVKLVDTDRQFVCGAQVSDMMEKSGAVGGINAGGFVDGADFNSNGGTPYGIIIEDGELVCGYENQSYRLVGMNKDNVMVVGYYSAGWALENGFSSAVTAEMVLVANGEKQITGGGGWGAAPRTALGQRATGEVIFLAVDGRQAGYSYGCDLGDLADILMDEGCVNAAMMDGGSSTVMETATYSAGGACTVELVNKPNLGHTLDAQRWINNAWVIMPKQTVSASVNAAEDHDGLVAK